MPILRLLGVDLLLDLATLVECLLVELVVVQVSAVEAVLVGRLLFIFKLIESLLGVGLVKALERDWVAASFEFDQVPVGFLGFGVAHGHNGVVVLVELLDRLLLFLGMVLSILAV